MADRQHAQPALPGDEVLAEVEDEKLMAVIAAMPLPVKRQRKRQPNSYKRERTDGRGSAGGSGRRQQRIEHARQT